MEPATEGPIVTRSRGRAPRNDSILAVQRKTTPPMVFGGGRGFRLQPAAAPERTRAITHSTAPCRSPVRPRPPDPSARSGSATQELGGDERGCSARTTRQERARDG